VAETPEGARAIYEQSIDQFQTKLVRATEALEEVAGQLDTAKRGLVAKQTELKNCEAQCERLASANQKQELELMAQERGMIMEEINAHQATINELEPIFTQAQEIVNFIEGELRRLEREKVTVVGNLERSIRVKEMYNMMDKVKKTNLDKLVGMVREGSQRKQELAVGAKVVHETKLSTKLEKIAADGNVAETQAYANGLMDKYAKKA
jgi:chromosome segregation ATPase